MATTSTGQAETKKATVNGLAVVGFGLLIVAGIALAIYAANYVPETLSRLSSAVILSTDGNQNNDTTASTTDEDTSDTNDTDTATVAKPKPTTTSTGGPLVTPQTPRVVVQRPNLYGLPDLIITNVEEGYIRGSSFVEDNEVPTNRDAAIRFTVRNAGTNIASNWRIRIDVEDEDTVTGTGATLNPNGTQTFTIRIEDPKEGEEIEATIEVDYQDSVDESNERNNTRTVRLSIED